MPLFCSYGAIKSTDREFSQIKLLILDFDPDYFHRGSYHRCHAFYLPFSTERSLTSHFTALLSVSSLPKHLHTCLVQSKWQHLVYKSSS